MGPKRTDLIEGMPEHRRCTCCGEVKPIAEMQSRCDRKRSRGHCKVCHRAYMLAKGREWRAANPEKARAAISAWEARNPRKVFEKSLRLRFGITADDYDRMFIAQGGCCAVCGSPQSAEGRRLAVDHDHVSGVIRGLLCGPCNRGLGLFYDDAGRLDRAAAYLRSHLRPESVSGTAEVIRLGRAG